MPGSWHQSAVISGPKGWTDRRTYVTLASVTQSISQRRTNNPSPPTHVFHAPRPQTATDAGQRTEGTPPRRAPHGHRCRAEDGRDGRRAAPHTATDAGQRTEGTRSTRPQMPDRGRKGRGRLSAAGGSGRRTAGDGRRATASTGRHSAAERPSSVVPRACSGRVPPVMMLLRSAVTRDDPGQKAVVVITL